MVKPQARRCVVCMSMSSMCGRCLLTAGLAATASSPRTVDIAIDIVSNHTISIDARGGYGAHKRYTRPCIDDILFITHAFDLP